MLFGTKLSIKGYPFYKERKAAPTVILASFFLVRISKLLNGLRRGVITPRPSGPFKIRSDAYVDYIRTGGDYMF